MVLPDILSEVCATNAGVALNIHVISQSQYNLLNLYCQLPGGGQTQDLRLSHCCIDTLEDGDGEGGSFTCTRLCLGDHISSLKNAS